MEEDRDRKAVCGEEKSEAERDKRNKGKNTAIVLAGGTGKRMHSTVPKQYMLIDGEPVLYYSLSVFENHPCIDEIILVAEKTAVEYCRREIVQKYGFRKISTVIPGGKERYHSVYEGLKACTDTDYVFIHDGARPLVDAAVLDRTYETAKKYGACVAGMPSKDTVKIADEDGFISYTPNRAQVWTVQTPQVFEYSLVRGAYDLLMKDENLFITDDAMVVEQLSGTRVRLAEGSYENIKITTPDDIPYAETILRARKMRKL